MRAWAPVIVGTLFAAFGVVTVVVRQRMSAYLATLQRATFGRAAKRITATPRITGAVGVLFVLIGLTIATLGLASMRS